MACTSPIFFETRYGTISGPCKQCLSCRIYRQKSLTLLCILENQLASSAEFWTLTYANAPEVGGWQDFSLFMKRLRKWAREEQGQMSSIRFFACGEYGHKSGRFHYHCLLWNAPALQERSRSTSPEDTALLTRLWPHGFVYIGQVTPASIGYTARYCLKWEEKGRASHANWSKSPPLGGPCISLLAAQMEMDGYDTRRVPTALKIDGTSYPITPTLQREWLRGLRHVPERDPFPSPLETFTDYEVETRLGIREARLLNSRAREVSAHKRQTSRRARDVL